MSYRDRRFGNRPRARASAPLPSTLADPMPEAPAPGGRQKNRAAQGDPLSAPLRPLKKNPRAAKFSAGPRARIGEAENQGEGEARRFFSRPGDKIRGRGEEDQRGPDDGRGGPLRRHARAEELQNRKEAAADVP